MLLKVWRTVLDLLKGGRGGRHLISFFKIGIVGCFSKNKTKTSRWKSILKGKSLTRLLLFSLLGTWFSFTGTKKQKRINTTDIIDVDKDFQQALKL